MYSGHLGDLPRPLPGNCCIHSSSCWKYGQLTTTGQQSASLRSQLLTRSSSSPPNLQLRIKDFTFWLLQFQSFPRDQVKPFLRFLLKFVSSQSNFPWSLSDADSQKLPTCKFPPQNCFSQGTSCEKNKLSCQTDLSLKPITLTCCVTLNSLVSSASVSKKCAGRQQYCVLGE